MTDPTAVQQTALKRHNNDQVISETLEAEIKHAQLKNELITLQTEISKAELTIAYQLKKAAEANKRAANCNAQATMTNIETKTLSHGNNHKSSPETNAFLRRKDRLLSILVICGITGVILTLLL